MDNVLQQLRDLPQKAKAMPPRLRYLVLGGLAVVVVLVVAFSVLSGGGKGYQYAFTNLSAEDSAEAAAALKAAGIPFNLEGGGSALAVPADKVHDARLLLAAAGLPRGGGVGFEIFDRGDLGVSEFTQRVNLRRALEGELSRTIGRLSEVRSARVHITLPDRGLYKDSDHQAAASVVLNLQPGRKVGDRELAGIRHLVASAVTGLTAEEVTVVDGRGSVLAAKEGAYGAANSEQRELERALEQRVISLLEPAVGAGAIVARVNAQIETAQVHTTAESFDPESAVLRSERKVSTNQSQNSNATGGLAGAAANQPLAAAGPGTATAKGSSSNHEEELRNYEVGKTVTRTVTRSPRLQRLSVAILVDGVNGKARTDAELARLADLAKGAVGFDSARGDNLAITSSPFSARPETPLEAVAAPRPWKQPRNLAIAGGAAVLLLLAVVLLARRGRRGSLLPEMALKPGVRVAEIEAALARKESASRSLPSSGPAALNDPQRSTRDRARDLVRLDPSRAAHLLKAWIGSDSSSTETRHG
jgi:flagellar M-ring protein FliF